MIPTLVLALVLSASTGQLPWQDLTLSIEKDFSTSSDHVTLCRVRVVNRGTRSWPGSRIRFEALALQGGTAMAREQGRFGLSLGPHETLETLIAFHGLYSRFEVRLLVKDHENLDSASRRGKTRPSRQKRKKDPG